MSTHISVKFVETSGRVFIPKRTEKRKIAHSACLDKLKSAYLKVTYGKGLENSGTYYTKKDFLQALNAFTEPKLLEHIENGRW